MPEIAEEKKKDVVEQLINMAMFYKKEIPRLMERYNIKDSNLEMAVCDAFAIAYAGRRNGTPPGDKEE